MAAKQAGKIHFIGFKGHKDPHVHSYLLATAARHGFAVAGEYALYKTSSHFDSTAHHPDWLGGETPKVHTLAPQNAG